MSTPRSPFERSPFNGIVGLLVGILIIYLLFTGISWAVWLLYKVAWLLFIASLVIDHTVFLGYAKSIGKLFERNWMMGLAAGALSIFLYPFVFLYLLGMALFKKKIKEKVKKRWPKPTYAATASGLSTRNYPKNRWTWILTMKSCLRLLRSRCVGEEIRRRTPAMMNYLNKPTP